jgi:hypothetical protein
MNTGLPLPTPEAESPEQSRQPMARATPSCSTKLAMNGLTGQSSRTAGMLRILVNMG